MKNNITELVFILDRSGSMSGLEGDTIGGFNSMIEKQRKQDGECYVSTILFDNFSEVLHDRVKLSDIPKMTDRDYTVRGCPFRGCAGAYDVRHHDRRLGKRQPQILERRGQKDDRAREGKVWLGIPVHRSKYRLCRNRAALRYRCRPFRQLSCRSSGYCRCL